MTSAAIPCKSMAFDTFIECSVEELVEKWPNLEIKQMFAGDCIV
jgi:hypothetical protein